MNDKVITDYGKGGDNIDDLNKIQNETNKEREELLKTAPEDIKIALDKIHEAASILDAAKIPFVLLASPQNSNGVMQYNRLSYIEPRFSEQDIQDSRINVVRFHRYLSSIYTGMFKHNAVCYVAPDGTIFEYIKECKVYDALPGLPRENKNVDKSETTAQDTKNEQNS